MIALAAGRIESNVALSESPDPHPAQYGVHRPPITSARRSLTGCGSDVSGGASRTVYATSYPRCDDPYQRRIRYKITAFVFTARDAILVTSSPDPQHRRKLARAYAA